MTLEELLESNILRAISELEYSCVHKHKKFPLNGMQKGIKVILKMLDDGEDSNSCYCALYALMKYGDSMNFFDNDEWREYKKPIDNWFKINKHILNERRRYIAKWASYSSLFDSYKNPLDPVKMNDLLQAAGNEFGKDLDEHNECYIAAAYPHIYRVYGLFGQIIKSVCNARTEYSIENYVEYINNKIYPGFIEFFNKLPKFLNRKLLIEMMLDITREISNDNASDGQRQLTIRLKNDVVVLKKKAIRKARFSQINTLRQISRGDVAIKDIIILADSKVEPYLDYGKNYHEEDSDEETKVLTK